MRKTAFLLLGILFCLTISVAYYVYQNRMGRDDDTTFQQLVHSVGLAATTKPTWCYINFDPRFDPRCSCSEWPIPGGYCFCPDHTGTVSSITGNVETGVSAAIVRNKQHEKTY